MQSLLKPINTFIHSYWQSMFNKNLTLQNLFMVNVKYTFSTVIFLSHFYLNVSTCTVEIYGIHCANLINSSELIAFGKENITTVFLKNISNAIDNVTFAHFPKLQHIDIQLSRIKAFSPSSASLNYLYIVKNVEFPNITNDFFERCCPNLTTLIISDNKNLNIAEGAFGSIQNLDHLTITGQNLTCISKTFFKGINKLTYLNLKENYLTEIGENSFDDLPQLTNLILSKNKLSNFEENTFQHLNNLQNLEILDLNISLSNINVFKNQKQLKFIGISTKWMKENLTINYLTKIFPNLETIGMSSEDKNDKELNKFIETNKYTGFTIEFLE